MEKYFLSKNNVISNYMGYSLSNDAIPYHNDWNELMQVIYSLSSDYGFVIYFYSNVCYVEHVEDFTKKNSDSIHYFASHYSDHEGALINAVWDACYDLIVHINTFNLPKYKK